MGTAQFQLRWRFRRLHEEKKRGAYVPYSPASGTWQNAYVKVAHKAGGSSAGWHGRYLMNQDQESIKKLKADLVGTIGDPIAFAKGIKKDNEHYRVVLSPKRGDLLNMKTFVRNTVRDVEHQIRQEIDYAAAIHKPKEPNSAGIYNLHAHLIIRGGYNKGANWLKARFREAAAREATRQLELDAAYKAKELHVTKEVILEQKHIKRKT